MRNAQWWYRYMHPNWYTLCTHQQTNKLKNYNYEMTTWSVSITMTLNKLSWKLQMIGKVRSTYALIVAHLKFLETHNNRIDICSHIGTHCVQTNKQHKKTQFYIDNLKCYNYHDSYQAELKISTHTKS